MLRVQFAKTDSLRVVYSGNLANYYFAVNKDIKCDSVIENEIALAEQSGKQNLIIYALFNNPCYKFIRTSTKYNSEQSLRYINRALKFSKNKALDDYTALAYSNLAAVYNSQGNTNQALLTANLALTTSINSANDSVKIICFLQLGNTYLQKSEIVMAFKMFTNANDIAGSLQNYELLSLVYRSIAELYRQSDNIPLAKEYIFKSLEIDKANNLINAQIQDYFLLGKIYEYNTAANYLREAEKAAASIGDIQSKVQAQKLLLYSTMVERSPAEALQYLQQHKELEAACLNTGPNYIDWIKGEIFLSGNMPDSALIYLKAAEPSFSTGYDVSLKKQFFGELADCYKLLHNTTAAIDYYKISLAYGKEVSDLKGLKNFTWQLKQLYRQQGDYTQALLYNDAYDLYKDTLEILSKEKDLALMEIDNENKKHIRDQEIALQAEQRRHNLQYLGITVIVVCAFILLLIIGMFKVSKLTIYTLGFFSFIFFFEFITLLLDNWIHGLTHGEPWKVWLIKIGIISILLPLHHFLEESVIRYLLSRKLLNFKSRLSLSRLFARNKKSPPALQQETALPETKILTSDSQQLN